MSNPDFNFLPKQAMDCLSKYAVLIADATNKNKFADNISAWFNAEDYRKYSGFKISRIRRSSEREYGFNSWIFETKSGAYGYVRMGHGLITIMTTEREYEAKFLIGAGNLPPKRIGLIYPICKQQLAVISTKEMCLVMGWTLQRDAEELWD